MKERRSMKMVELFSKKIFASMLAVILSVTIVVNTDVAYAASSSGSWTTYYASGGGSDTSKTISLATFAGTYNASCTSITGNCTSIIVNIKAYSNSGLTKSVALSKTVQFTRVSSLNFTLSTVPSTSSLYFRVNMSYANGTLATSTGTIKMN